MLALPKPKRDRNHTLAGLERVQEFERVRRFRALLGDASEHCEQHMGCIWLHYAARALVRPYKYAVSDTGIVHAA